MAPIFHRRQARSRGHLQAEPSSLVSTEQVRCERFNISLYFSAHNTLPLNSVENNTEAAPTATVITSEPTIKRASRHA